MLWPKLAIPGLSKEALEAADKLVSLMTMRDAMNFIDVLQGVATEEGDEGAYRLMERLIDDRIKQLQGFHGEIVAALERSSTPSSSSPPASGNNCQEIPWHEQ